MSEFNNPWAADHSSWYNEEATKWLSPKNKPSDSKIKKVSRDDFPSPQKIISNYPSTIEDCCDYDRMSIALQQSGVDISDSSRFRKTHKHEGSSEVHQRSAMALVDWLHNTLKNPQKYDNDLCAYVFDNFKTKEGIIYFVPPTWGGSGPGYIDVIHDGKIGSQFYNNDKIWFWEYKNGW